MALMVHRNTTSVNVTYSQVDYLFMPGLWETQQSV